MTLTLLLDLDDTLLVNPLEQFMPRYIGLLSEKLSLLIPPEKMVPQLMTATDMMIENQNPSEMLKDVFDRNFFLPWDWIKRKRMSPSMSSMPMNSTS